MKSNEDVMEAKDKHCSHSVQTKNDNHMIIKKREYLLKQL